MRRANTLRHEHHRLLALWAAAYTAGQAGCVPHVAEHDLGAAAYAIEAVRAAEDDTAGRRECA